MRGTRITIKISQCSSPFGGDKSARTRNTEKAEREKKKVGMFQIAR